jgi:hypothetical protein
MRSPVSFLSLSFFSLLLSACGPTGNTESPKPDAAPITQLSCNKDKEQLLIEAQALSDAGKHRDAFSKIADCRFQSSDPRYVELAKKYRTMEARNALSSLPKENWKERLENLRILKVNDPEWTAFKSEYEDLEKQDATLKHQAFEVASAEAKARHAAEKAAKAQLGVYIGMSAEDARESSWGEPQDINRTTTAHGVREQWVYGPKTYLYFTNGKLTAIQN